MSRFVPKQLLHCIVTTYIGIRPTKPAYFRVKLDTIHPAPSNLLQVNGLRVSFLTQKFR